MATWLTTTTLACSPSERRAVRAIAAMRGGDDQGAMDASHDASLDGPKHMALMIAALAQYTAHAMTDMDDFIGVGTGDRWLQSAGLKTERATDT